LASDGDHLCEEANVAAIDVPPQALEDIAPPLKRTLGEALLIVAIALTLNLVGNGRTTLWDRDEPRYATCTREMRARGDFLYPTFNGEPRFQKPVFIYWLMMAGMAVAGDNPFGARLVSSLAGAATCLAVWALGRRMLGRRVGFLAGLIAATVPIMIAESKLATTDATLALLLVGCQFALWELSQRDSRAVALGFWTCLGLSMLTKGPVGPALIAVAGIVSWWWGGPTQCWKRLRWRWGLIVFLAINAPWFIAIGIVSKGQFFREAIDAQIVQRIRTGLEEHGGLPGYYLLGTLLTFHPWSALLPPAIFGAWTRRRADPAMGFLLGWVVGPWFLLECVTTKLVHYYLPAIPACVLLSAWLICRVAESDLNIRRWPLGRLAMGLLAAIGFGATVSCLAGAVVFPWALRWPALVIAIVIAAGTLLALERFHSGRTPRAAHCLIATWGLVMLVSGAWLLPATEPFRISPMVANRLAAVSAQEQATPVLVGFQQPSVVYLLGRPAPTMRDKAWFSDRVRRDGAVVTALLADELKVLRNDLRWTVEVREVIQGFNIDKGRNEVLQLVVVRPPDASRLARAAEQTTVK
jgi:4-amino-4-deoxy-L-arabinose transferase-like glycosyltransferase